MSVVRNPGILVVFAALVGCGDKNDGGDLAALDAQLTNNTADPALRAAVEDKITVDPDLVAQSNRNSIRPSDKPLNGAVPPRVSAPIQRNAAEQLAGGVLMQAPAATSRVTEGGSSLTLGGLARIQSSGRKASRCAPPRIRYAMDWAGRLPGAFPLYPGAQLTEAAGADNGPCAIRAVSFTTSAPVQDVINFYYTTARRSGYSAERQTSGADEILGGTKGDGAYYIRFSAIRGGGTAVDLIANGGS
jgi:hypothetical protein